MGVLESPFSHVYDLMMDVDEAKEDDPEKFMKTVNCVDTFSFISFATVVRSDTAKCGTSLSNAFSCQGVYDYYGEEGPPSITLKRLPPHPYRRALSSCLYALIECMTRKDNAVLIRELRNARIYGQLFEPFALSHISRQEKLELHDAESRLSYSFDLEVPQYLPQLLPASVSSLKSVDRYVTFTCARGEHHIDGLLAAEGQLIRLPPSSVDPQPINAKDPSVLFLFQATTTDDHSIKNKDSYLSMVDKLMRLTGIKTVIPVLVVPMGVNPSHATIESYKITSAPSPIRVLDVAVLHISTAMTQVYQYPSLRRSSAPINEENVPVPVPVPADASKSRKKAKTTTAAATGNRRSVRLQNLLNE
jgi:hypothetical protein